MTYEEKILTSTLAITALGFLATVISIHLTNKVKRADFILKLLEHIRTNDKITSAIYIIDYSTNWYNSNFHNNSKNENIIDAYFAMVDYICYLYKKRILCKKDLKIFNYSITRVYHNSDSRCYLWNLYHWSKNLDTNCSFNYLIEHLKNNLMNDVEKQDFESTEEKGIYIRYI